MDKSFWNKNATACIAALVLGLAGQSACADPPKTGSTAEALKDPDAQPSQATPRSRPPSQGPNKTGDAMKDPDAQRSQATPRSRPPSQGPNKTGDAMKDPDAQPSLGQPRR
jgi:uncharacterized protein YjgD (DUF1641 family)